MVYWMLVRYGSGILCFVCFFFLTSVVFLRLLSVKLQVNYHLPLISIPSLLALNCRNNNPYPRNESAVCVFKAVQHIYLQCNNDFTDCPLSKYEFMNWIMHLTSTRSRYIIILLVHESRSIFIASLLSRRRSFLNASI